MIYYNISSEDTSLIAPLIDTFDKHDVTKSFATRHEVRDAAAGGNRALDFLMENGFIHKLESINAYVSCHHPSVAHHVPFLICDVCEGATEICDERVAKLLSDQAKALGFKSRAQTLEVHGVCKRCGNP